MLPMANRLLAHDVSDERVQRQVCGGWYRWLTVRHLRHHGLDAWSSKGTFGLNVATPLQSRGLREFQCRLLWERAAKCILKLDPPTPLPGSPAAALGR